MLQELAMQVQGQSTWQTTRPHRRKPAEDLILSRTNRLRGGSTVAERPSIVEAQVERRAEGKFEEIRNI